MKIFSIAFLLSWSGLAQAGLPPTTSKANGEASYSTTFSTNYDTIPVTRSGTNITIGTIPISKGGTGSTTQSFVDLTTNQTTIAGSKGFTLPIGVGAAPSATAAVNINPTVNAGNTQYGLLQNTVFGASTTTAATGIWSRINTANSAFTLIDAIAFDLVNLSRGAASAVTNSTGLMVRDQTQATNNYGIQNLVSSGANKWGYYGSGTANNVFAGNTRFGSAVAPTSTVDITGTLTVSTPIGAASGGTGLSSPGTSGNILTSNGTAWVSSAPSAGPRSYVYVDTGNGHGSVATKIRRFTNTRASTGTDITYADSATNGSSFTINSDGLYGITSCDYSSTAASSFGYSVNSVSLATSITTISYPTGLRGVTDTATSIVNCISSVLFLSNTDVIRPHTDGTQTTTTQFVRFSIIKITN